MESQQEETAKRAKPWKGEKRSGPAPARHIPWPEIFKHHISVVEGHTRMLEMIQKHTTKGTGNWETITAMVKRGHEMLHQAKDSSRSFVPPPNQGDQVPLGSSSASMYPGYSLSDIEYGKAAREFGQAVGDMRSKGANWQPPVNETEYKIGHAHRAKRKLLFQKDKTENSGVEDSENTNAKAEEPKNATEKPVNDNGANPYFVIYTNPSPVTLPARKRALEEYEGEKKKKAKKEKEEEIVIETEDISAEVEARLKAKEAKAKSKDKKKEKKRRRESGSEDVERVVKKSKKNKEKESDICSHTGIKL